ncbi:MAG: HAD-IA family hydrolase, partial [Clostridiales bacterium]|nr:HAD-IA family hydrolase [Clostridiales bacterium]
MSIKAVVFDLDDTLFSEVDYVKSGFKAVAEYVEGRFGLKNVFAELVELFERDRSGVFDRFVAAHGLDGAVAGSFTELYREHFPNIVLSDEVKQTLAKLRADGFKLGIVTDGRPTGQRNKIAALGLDALVDRIIVTDELGGAEFRKPNPKAFELMCDEFGIDAEQMLYVGDNPQKDFAVKKYLPIKTARVSTHGGLYENGEYKFN